MVQTVMVDNSTNINKTNNHPHHKPPNTKKTTTYDVGNPGPSLKQAHTCDRIKPDNGILTLPCALVSGKLLNQ